MNILVYSRYQLDRMLERNDVYRTYGAIIYDEARGRSTIIRPSSSGNWIVFEEYRLRSPESLMISEDPAEMLEGDRIGSGNAGNAAPAPTRQEARTPAVHHPAPSRLQRESRWFPELIGAGLSCTFAVGAGVSLFAEGAATGLSGGTAAPVTLSMAVASWTGFTTGTAQCLLGTHRLFNELSNSWEGQALNDVYDNDLAYQRATFLIDALGIASSVRGLFHSFETYRRTATSVAQRVAPAEVRSLQANTRLWGRRPQTLLARLPESERGAVSGTFTGMRLPRSVRQRFILEYNQVATRLNSAARAAHIQESTYILRGATRLWRSELGLMTLQLGINAAPASYFGGASGSVNTLLDSESWIRRDIDADIQARRQFRDPRGLTIHVIESGNTQ